MNEESQLNKYFRERDFDPSKFEGYSEQIKDQVEILRKLTKSDNINYNSTIQIHFY